MAVVDYEVHAQDVLAAVPVLRSKIAAAIETDPGTARRALVEAMRFLRLVAGSDETLSPPRRVDLAWHEFILCTRVYDEYCRRRFGRFIHHHPGGEPDRNRRQYRRALELYEREFGTPDPFFWGRDASLLAAGCGECEGREDSDDNRGAICT